MSGPHLSHPPRLLLVPLPVCCYCLQASSTAVAYEASSRGLLNHYVYGSDDTINTMGPGQDADRSLWYFMAPQKFLGHHGIAYGGSLDFVLSSFHGDFSPDKLNTGLDSSGLHLIELYCATCNVNRGVTLAFPAKATAAFTGAATSYSIALTEVPSLPLPLLAFLPPCLPSFLHVCMR